jgi:hypothetical protein
LIEASQAENFSITRHRRSTCLWSIESSAWEMQVSWCYFCDYVLAANFNVKLIQPNVFVVEACGNRSKESFFASILVNNHEAIKSTVFSGRLCNFT